MDNWYMVIYKAEGRWQTGQLHKTLKLALAAKRKAARNPIFKNSKLAVTSVFLLPESNIKELLKK